MWVTRSKDVKKIDLALTLGQPSFLEVYEVLKQHMEIEHVTIAEEMEVDNAPIFEQVTKDFSEIEQVNHETFKALTKTLKQLFEQKQRHMQTSYFKVVSYFKG